MQKVSISGVILGGIVDIAGTSLLGAVLVIVHPAAFLDSAIVQWGLGAIGSIAGGYAAAAMARHDESLNGALSSIFCIALGILVWTSGFVAMPAWEHLAELIGSPLLGALGGYIRAAVKRGNAPVRTA